MENKKKNLIIFIIYNLIILGLIIFIIVKHSFCLNPNKIFNKTIDSIIEVKLVVMMLESLMEQVLFIIAKGLLLLMHMLLVILD